MSPLAKRMALMLVAAGLVFGGVLAFEAYRARAIRQFLAAQAPPPQTVSTLQAEYSEWQPMLEAVGALRAVNGTDVASEVAGLITVISFESGQDVAAGNTLLRLRDEDDRAKLDSLRAAAELARSTFERDQEQFRIEALSQAQLDIDAATLKSAEAQVTEQQAIVDQKSIRAPFAGRLGIRAVDVGQFLSPGATIVTLQALDPLFLDFYVPQEWLSEIAPGQPLSAQTNAFAQRVFHGEITAIDAAVDASTRNILVRARIPNPTLELLPGMYATVSIAAGPASRHITLPQTAISYNPYGSSVFLVEQQGEENGKPRLIAKQQFVTTGDTRGDQIAVLTGVAANDTVVTAGQIKLRNGTPVVVNNAIQLPNNPAPEPTDP